MSRIPYETRDRLLELWLRGYTYRAIESKLRVSLGSISQIIREAEKEAPYLRFLKKLNK